MNLVDEKIDAVADELAAMIAALDIDERVAALNRARAKLHAVSPFQSEPVDLVLWEPGIRFRGNDYNPNSVASPEMRLLDLSIRADGFTQPVVGFRGQDSEEIEVVDGFHRTRVAKEKPSVRSRLHGYIPVTLIQASRSERNDRIAATIRHNRARGVHAVRPMMEIVVELLQRGWTDDEVARELGMDADEVLRFKQVKGLPSLFANGAYSRAWE